MRGEAQRVEHKPLCADRSDMDLRSVFLCVLLEVLPGNCEYAFTFTRARERWASRNRTGSLMFDPGLIKDKSDRGSSSDVGELSKHRRCSENKTILTETLGQRGRRPVVPDSCD